MASRSLKMPWLWLHTDTRPSSSHRAMPQLVPIEAWARNGRL